MITFADVKDLSKFADLGRWYHYRTHAWIGEFNKEIFSGYWKTMLESGNGFIATREVAGFPHEAMGVYIYPDPLTGKLSGTVGFWFVLYEPKGLEAGVLFKKVMDILRERKVKMVHLGISLSDGRYDKMSAFVAKAGFRPTEMHVVKEL